MYVLHLEQTMGKISVIPEVMIHRILNAHPLEIFSKPFKREGA
jgi:hypothetical protein